MSDESLNPLSPLDPTVSATPSATSGPPRTARCWVHLPRNRWRRILFLALYLSFCVALLYAGEKLFWKLYAGVPFGVTAEIWDQFYPVVRTSGVKDVHPRHDDDRFDVLLLGASAMDPGWGIVNELLAGKLREELGDRFRSFNFARPAHTSRDSLLKYSLLGNEQFDLVIVYDGFNDARLNCASQVEFRDDYSHTAWYRAMNRQLETGSLSFPSEVVKEMIQTMPLGAIDQKNAEEGRDIKTAVPFRHNIETIVETAALRGDRILLLTYAYDIPAGYTPELFASHSLAYGERVGGTAIGANGWGQPAYVAAAVDAHNAVIRELAAKHDEALFVDQQELIPKQQRLFVDSCHFTDAGCRRFVDNLWPVVAQRIAEWKAARLRRAGRE